MNGANNTEEEKITSSFRKVARDLSALSVPEVDESSPADETVDGDKKEQNITNATISERLQTALGRSMAEKAKKEKKKSTWKASAGKTVAEKNLLGKRPRDSKQYVLNQTPSSVPLLNLNKQRIKQIHAVEKFGAEQKALLEKTFAAVQRTNLENSTRQRSESTELKQSQLSSTRLPAEKSESKTQAPPQQSSALRRQQQGIIDICLGEKKNASKLELTSTQRSSLLDAVTAAIDPGLQSFVQATRRTATSSNYTSLKETADLGQRTFLQLNGKPATLVRQDIIRVIGQQDNSQSLLDTLTQQLDSEVQAFISQTRAFVKAQEEKEEKLEVKHPKEKRQRVHLSSDSVRALTAQINSAQQAFLLGDRTADDTITDVSLIINDFRTQAINPDFQAIIVSARNAIRNSNHSNKKRLETRLHSIQSDFLERNRLVLNEPTQEEQEIIRNIIWTVTIPPELQTVILIALRVANTVDDSLQQQALVSTIYANQANFLARTISALAARQAIIAAFNTQELRDVFTQRLDRRLFKFLEKVCAEAATLPTIQKEAIERVINENQLAFLNGQKTAVEVQSAIQAQLNDVPRQLDTALQQLSMDLYNFIVKARLAATAQQDNDLVAKIKFAQLLFLTEQEQKETQATALEAQEYLQEAIDNLMKRVDFQLYTFLMKAREVVNVSANPLTCSDLNAIFTENQLAFLGGNRTVSEVRQNIFNAFAEQPILRSLLVEKLDPDLFNTSSDVKVIAGEHTNSKNPIRRIASELLQTSTTEAEKSFLLGTATGSQALQTILVTTEAIAIDAPADSYFNNSTLATGLNRLNQVRQEASQQERVDANKDLNELKRLVELKIHRYVEITKARYTFWGLRPQMCEASKRFKETLEQELKQADTAFAVTALIKSKITEIRQSNSGSKLATQLEKIESTEVYCRHAAAPAA